MMDLSQHSREDVRQAYDFICRLGWFGARIVELCELQCPNPFALEVFIQHKSGMSFTFGEAKKIAAYVRACRDLARIVARLQGMDEGAFTFSDCEFRYDPYELPF